MKYGYLLSILLVASNSNAQDFSSSYSNALEYEQIKDFDPSTMEMVLSINSFPAFLEVGDSDEMVPNSKTVPQPIMASATFQKCQFKIATTDYALSTYKLAKNKEFLPLQDSVIPRTKIIPNSRINAALVSVSTSLKLVIEKENLANCEATFKNLGKTLVGEFAISGSKTHVSIKETSKKGPIVKQAESTEIYLMWNKSDKKIYLLDDEDFVPMVTSEIFALNPKEEGLYEIHFEPHAKFISTKIQISKNEKEDLGETFFGH